MDINALKEAIKRRRGGGVDLKIIVGGEDIADDSSDLAPEVKDAPMNEHNEEAVQTALDGVDPEMGQEKNPSSEPPKASLAAMVAKHGMGGMGKKMLAMKKDKDTVNC